MVLYGRIGMRNKKKIKLIDIYYPKQSYCKYFGICNGMKAKQFVTHIIN